MDFDLLIRNARTRNSGTDTVDIGIKDGTITSIASGIRGSAGEELDAGGKLVTESYVNGHLHLCKVYTLERIGEEALSNYSSGSMGAAMTAIELAARVKDEYDQRWIIENVRRAADLAVHFGNTHIRAFADTDTTAGLEGVKALLQAREEYKDRLDLQVVAFPQDGVVRDPGAAQYVEEAMDLGADVVGGIPWIEYTDDDARKHIDTMFALAKKYDKDVSMLIDDAGDATLKTLEMLLVKTMQEGWEGRVTVQHARAMQLYPDPYYKKMEALMKQTRVGVVSDPQTGPLHARVRELYDAGVNVALGQDDISDAFYPFGRNNMLEVAFLAAHLLWMTTVEEMNILYDMITTNAARAMGVQNHELKEGGNADLVVLKEENVVEALRNHEAPRYVIRKGKNVTV
jgi:cytosine deaminase